MCHSRVWHHMCLDKRSLVLGASIVVLVLCLMFVWRLLCLLVEE